jgi:hypothetical protein
VKPAHFLNLRWRQDYRFVTELRGRGVGPLEQVGLRLQQTKPDPWALYEETIPGVGDVITMFGRKFLEFDGRRAVWQHSLVYPLGTLDRAAARGIFRAAYGGDPGVLLPVLYELLAPLEHWEGDPLARRMFIGATTAPPEPIAATLIRELWSSRLPPGPERAAQLDALEALRSGAGAPGVLDEPTLEERAAAPPTGDRSPGGPGPETDQSPPVPAGLLTSSWRDPTSVRVVRESAKEPDDHAAQSHDAEDVSSYGADPETDALDLDAVEVAAVEAAAVEAAAVEAAAVEVAVAGAGPLQPPAPLSASAVALSGGVGPDTAGLDLAEAWSSPRRGAVPFYEAVFSPPTDEIVPEAAGAEAESEEEEELELEPDQSAERRDSSGGAAPVVESGLAEGPTGSPQRAHTSQLDTLKLLEIDEDSEDDDKTVISPLTSSTPSALSEAETRLNIPVPTAAQLAALAAERDADRAAPPAAPLGETASLSDNERPDAKKGDDRRRPIIIGGLIGLIAALLALGVVWTRTTSPDVTTAGARASLHKEPPQEPPKGPTPAPAAPGGAAFVNGAEETEGTPEAPSAADLRCYSDRDRDGYGHKAPVASLVGGECPMGTALKGGDCDDDDPLVYPGALELCDQRDNNCNTTVDDNRQLRDDNADGKMDCLQADPASGMGRLKVSGEIKGGANGQAPYLLLHLTLPEGSRGACKQELRFGRGVSGPRTRERFTTIAAEQSCGVPVQGGALPDKVARCVKGMTIAEKAESVSVEAACCMQNQGSYGSYLTTKRADDMESCEYLQTSGVFDVKSATALSAPP